VDQARPLGRIAHVFENRDQLVQVVPVDRADVVEAQFLEQRAAHGHAAGKLVGLLGGLVQRARQRRDRRLAISRSSRNGRDETSRAR
jgi:hypothetical protein